MNKLSGQIRNIIYKYKSRFLLIFCFYLLFSIFNVLPNYLVGKIVDNINKPFQMIMLYLLIRLLSIGVKTLINYFQTKLSLNLISDIKEYYFSLILKNDNLFSLTSSENSQIITRILDASESLNKSILNIIIWTGKSVPTLVLTVYFICKIDIKISMFIIPLIFLLYFISKKLQHIQSDNAKECLQSKSYIVDLFHEIIKQLYAIQLFELQEHFLKKYKDSSNEWKNKQFKFDFISQESTLLINLFGALVITTILIFSILFSSTINTGNILSLILYTGSMFMVISDVFENISVFSNMNTAIARINILLKETNNNFLSKEVINNYDITIENLTFSYKDMRIFNDVSFPIPFGSKVAIIGKNGSGKSTLLKLLCGIYKNYSGNIKIGGKDIKDVNLSNIYSISFQDSYIFNDTVRNNITLWEKNSGELYSYDDLDKGLDTIVINGGQNLSGGQRQRICLNRMFLKNAKVYLIDEYENNLDNITKDFITKKILNLSGTVIISSHDSQILSKVDYIYDLDNKILRKV